jgi:hypothetical protein
MAPLRQTKVARLDDFHAHDNQARVCDRASQTIRRDRSHEVIPTRHPSNCLAPRLWLHERAVDGIVAHTGRVLATPTGQYVGSPFPLRITRA